MENMVSVPYSSAIGSVMYTIICTRPDITHSISLLSKYMSNPGRIHWEALKYFLRYIKSTMNEGLVYHSSKKGVELIDFFYSNYAGDRDKRRSTTTYVFALCGNCVG